MPNSPVTLSTAQARRIWLHAQCLDQDAPFGAGPEAVRAAVAHLGYVQIDTINVIERCHHHILFNRIPEYRRDDLRAAQSAEKAVFEYWTHALAYVPSADFRFFLPAMRAYQPKANGWFAAVTASDQRRVLKRIRDEGPLTIRDVEDEPVEKDHLWASRKPTKRVLELLFYKGALTISARAGMVKTYELTERHFGWAEKPRAATEAQVLNYKLDRALRAQGIISLDSVAYGKLADKPGLRALIEARVKKRRLVTVMLEGAEKLEHWAEPAALAHALPPADGIVHILSPFDPLVIQRKRLNLMFGYDHRFEAYLPAEKRVFGYFSLPVLVDDRIAGVIDLKTDRAAGRLLIQRWTDLTYTAPGDRERIEAALTRFERFQLGAAQ